jgi:uncharacterized membrane protein
MKTEEISFVKIILLCLVGLLVLQILATMLPLIEKILGMVLITSFIVWILFKTGIFKK